MYSLGDGLETRVQVRVSALKVGEQPARGDALRHGIAARDLDRRQVGGGDWNWASKQSEKEKRSDAARHGTPT